MPERPRDEDESGHEAHGMRLHHDAGPDEQAGDKGDRQRVPHGDRQH